MAVSLRPHSTHFINMEFFSSFSFCILEPQQGHCMNKSMNGIINEDYVYSDELQIGLYFPIVLSAIFCRVSLSESGMG
jgi:hypothetical protein